MKQHIGKAHEQKGYFITAQKDIKKGRTQTYRGIFVVYDHKEGEWCRPNTESGFTSRSDARTWAEGEFAEFQKQGKAATIASKRGKTNFSVFAERYKKFLQETIPNGWKQEWQKVGLLMGFFGEDDLKDIDYDRIEDFKRWFVKQTYTRKEGGQEFHRNISTVHRYLARLRHMQRNASDRYGTTVPSFGHFIKKSDEKPEKIVITFDEFKRMMRVCDELFPRRPQNRDGWKLVLLAAYTLGCRAISELFKIRRSDIIRIDHVNRVGAISLQIEDSKTKKHKKTVDIPTVLFDAMEKAGCFDKDGDERLFMWTKYYRKPFDKIKELAKVNPKATFKSLRTSNATARDAAGQDFHAIQATMGHVPGSGVTTKHYIDRAAETTIEKAKPYNDHLNGLNWSDDGILDAEILNSQN